MMLKKSKQYYTLTELESIVDLKLRALKYRMLKVKAKYANNKKLLFKNGKNWNIHKSIVFEFDRKKLTKAERELEFNSLVTISPDSNYDVAAMLAVVKEVHRDLKRCNVKTNFRIKYYLEQGELGKRFHIHFITNLTSNHKKLIIRVSNHYINCNVDVRQVHEVRNLINYLNKEVKAQGYIS